MEQTFTLRATDLYSKFGFEDGDMFMNFMWDEFGYGRAEHMTDPLIALVKTYLLPLLPEGMDVEEYASAHNPIRATDYGDHIREESPYWAACEAISVTITRTQVLHIIEQMEAR